MASTALLRPVGEVLAEVERLLDQVDPHRSVVAARQRLEWVRTARRVRGRMDALTGLLTAEADRANASQQAMGTPLNSWLGTTEVLSRREANAAVGQARTMAGHPAVAEAAVAGRLGAGQVRSIGKVLDSLAPQLTTTQQDAAEAAMLELARRLDADQLAQAAGQVLAAVVPVAADELEETRLQREHEAAWRQRSLRLFRDRGSLRFEGSLPKVEGERFLAALNVHAESVRRSAIEARDPLAGQTTPEQRRADAFIALLGSVEKSKPMPGLGCARVLVTLDYAKLLADAADAGLVAGDDPLSAGELRRLCCDAELIPAVLGGDSCALDVGRAVRLVTAPIRTALVLRDGGCAFPGCGMTEALCEAHHIVPWWAGGTTSLSNLVLLCHQHHGVVEPSKFGLRDQWVARIGTEGLPEFVPPARLDPGRRPLRRSRIGDRAAIDGAGRRSEPPPAQAGSGRARLHGGSGVRSEVPRRDAVSGDPMWISRAKAKARPGCEVVESGGQVVGGGGQVVESGR